jgi:hypothetical protein
MKDKDLLGALMRPAPRLAWGFLLLAPIALTRGWPALLAETACALALALLSGKRFRPLAASGFLAAMIAFSLIQPRGEVLVRLGGLPLVTRDALIEGMERGLRILCMVQVSGFSVSASLRIPGAFGGLLSGVLSRFHALMDLRGRIDRKDVMGSVDRLLFAVYDPRGDNRGTDSRERRRRRFPKAKEKRTGHQGSGRWRRAHSLWRRLSRPLQPRRSSPGIGRVKRIVNKERKFRGLGSGPSGG